MEDDQALCVGCEQPLVEEDGANAEKDKQKKAVKAGQGLWPVKRQNSSVLLWCCVCDVCTHLVFPLP